MKKFPTRFKGYYVTEDGRVFRDPIERDKTSELIEVNQNPRGGIDPNDRYMSVNISIKDENGKFIRQIKYYTHRLVAETLIENPNNCREVDHIDRNKTNNRKENLRWATRKENWMCPDRDSTGKWVKL